MQLEQQHSVEHEWQTNPKNKKETKYKPIDKENSQWAKKEKEEDKKPVDFDEFYDQRNDGPDGRNPWEGWGMIIEDNVPPSDDGGPDGENPVWTPINRKDSNEEYDIQTRERDLTIGWKNSTEDSPIDGPLPAGENE